MDSGYIAVPVICWAVTVHVRSFCMYDCVPNRLFQRYTLWLLNTQYPDPFLCVSILMHPKNANGPHRRRINIVFGPVHPGLSGDKMANYQRTYARSPSAFKKNE